MYDPERDPPNIRKETKPNESKKVDDKTVKFAGKVALGGK
jgi:hypothetical protein